jgi:hypothetical protein
MQADPERAAARLAWARQAARDPALELVPASSDASFRSYWRGTSGGRSLIVMDSPPAREDPRPWLAIGARLAAAGLHVPAVYAQDLERGFLLIEDLGNRLYQSELDEASADRLYAQAMDALLRMRARVDSAGLPRFDRALALQGLEVMPEWFLGRHLGQAPDAAERAILDAAFAAILANHEEQPQGFVHRDYHCRNLLVLEANGPGIIDFQGALHGPVAYDLASLLRDAYVAWPAARVEAWAEAYRQRLLAAGHLDGGVDRERFRRWFDLTGLQRHLRLLGQFYRLWYRDGKPGYLADVPRIYGYVLEVAGRYPELHGLAALLERRAQGRDLALAAQA